MDTPQLHAIGFDTPTIEDLITKAFDAGVRGVDTAPGFAMIGTYTDPSGARLAFIQREGKAVSTTAGLQAETRYRAQVVRFTDLLARVALYGTEGDGPLKAQFLAMVDDPFAYPQHDLREANEYTVIENLQVGALAIDVEVYPDATAFLASPESRAGGLQLGIETLMSPGLVGLQAAAITPAEATPTMLMAVTVDTAEPRTNRLTGVDFQYVLGRGAVDLSCAIPLDRPVEPGNVVFGTWYGTCSSGLWDVTSDQQA